MHCQIPEAFQHVPGIKLFFETNLELAIVTYRRCIYNLLVYMDRRGPLFLVLIYISKMVISSVG